MIKGKHSQKRKSDSAEIRVVSYLLDVQVWIANTDGSYNILWHSCDSSKLPTEQSRYSEGESDRSFNPVAS